MGSNPITMSDYQGLGGGFHGGFAGRDGGPLAAFGGNVEAFYKALAANYQSPRSEGSAALRVESLEQTMRVLTYRARHIVLWHDVPKAPTYSTVHEFNQQTSYGVENGAFVRPGEAPQVQDSAYRRQFVPVKYMATQREVDHPTSLVRSAHGDVVAAQTRDGSLWLMKMAEKALINGRSSCVPEEWDGYDEMLRNDPTFGTTNILDLRGGVMTYEKAEEGANFIEENYGEATDLYMSMRALSDFGKQQQVKERYTLPAPQSGTIGMALKTLQLQSNEVNIKKDIFLRPGRDNNQKSAPAAATASRAPSAPTISIAIVNNISTSLFAAADVGTWRYKVAARNRFGSSAASASTTAAISAALDVADITVTDGGGSDGATCYDLYRTLIVGGVAGTEQFVRSYPRVGSAATTVIRDYNRFLPGTSRCLMFQMNEEAVGFVQLAPMFKIPFGTQALSLRWAQGMYGAPLLRNPGRIVIFDNVADD